MIIPGDQSKQLDAKLGRIILGALNRDIGVFDAVRAFFSFFKHDYMTSRRLSRLKRADEMIEDLTPVEALKLLEKYKMDPVRYGISLIKDLRRPDPMKAGEYASELANYDLSVKDARFVAFTIFEGGGVTLAANLLHPLSVEDWPESARIRRQRVLSEHTVLKGDLDGVFEPLAKELEDSLSDKLKHRPPVIAGKMAYVAASSLPHNRVGYATRTHRLLSSLQKTAHEQGGSVLALLRPGFPYDRFDLSGADEFTETSSLVDDIVYHYSQNDVAMQDDLIAYAKSAASVLAERFIEEGVSSVQAASNHVNGMCAFIAARALGLPFTYEVRGLWEETTDAKKPGWVETERFKVERSLETYLIANADRTFFITRQVKEVFFPTDGVAAQPGAINPNPGGLPASDLAPNCADVAPDAETKIEAYRRAPKQRLNLTYIGSLVQYEGLQLLLEVLSESPALREKFQLNVVGAGNYGATLRRSASELQLGGTVNFIGRVESHEVAEWFEQADLILVPRLPNRVCQLVSPLKPLEAMSSGRVCLASNVAPLADLIEDGVTGFTFEAGDPASLREKLEEVFERQNDFPVIAKKALDYVITHRNWHDVTKRMFYANNSED